jgi:hypothetical protein
MTILQLTNQPARRAGQRCDHCGGPFGLVTHRWWGGKFCKRSCKEVHIRERINLERRTIHRWCGLLTGMLLSRPSRQKRGFAL